MEKRENALREALDKNAYEADRWNQYIKENEDAINNLNKFSQHLSVDVMVPVGKKMFMPGKLIHTNEVLVGHFQGYFSKCSAKKASEICDLRVKKAKEHVEKLKVEEELWMNNLEKPYVEGVMPTGYEQEIIEEYDEERETQWRETHKVMLRHHKMREKEERQQVMNKNIENEKNDNNGDILKILEERELMEELENELESLEIDNVSDETIKQIMSGNMSLPSEKKRIAHDASDKLNPKPLEIISTQTSNIEKKQSKKSEECISSSLDTGVEKLHDGDEDEEFLKIKEQLKYLPAEDQESFLECQIKIVKQKLKELKLHNIEDLIEKTRLYGLLDDIQDMLGCIEEEDSSEVEITNPDKNKTIKTTMQESQVPIEQNKTAHMESNKKQKRKISFALNNETLEFRRNEAVAQLLPRNTRDKITFDESVPAPKPLIAAPNESKEDLIRKRVEKNLNYVYENQSAKDSNLIDKIINENDSPFPICINFKHNGNCQAIENTDNNVPASPSDFYKNYVRIKEQQNESNKLATNVIYFDGYKGEEDVHVPLLREAEYNKAYIKPIHEFSKSNSNIKNAVPVEKKSKNPQSKTKAPAKKRLEEEEFSAYSKVMGDVIDKTFDGMGAVEGVPDPLPTQNYVDAHAPKKRISRFRQSREACKASS